MDLNQLRNLLRFHIFRANVRHKDIANFCKQRGLSEPPKEDEGSKAERLSAAFAATPDYELANVAERLLVHQPMSPADRNRLQDIIWPDSQPIPKRYRREVARALRIDDLFEDASKFDQLIASLFVLERDLDIFAAFDGSSLPPLKDQIERHVHRNPGDWDVEYLFNELGAIDASDTRFARFLEGLVDPDVMPDEESQRRFVKIVNSVFVKCGLEFREVTDRDGYPVFALVATELASATRPKNLIFASPEKPDLRFHDAVNNDVEIVTEADKVLIYDRPIPVDGIRWCDLQTWWKELHSIKDDDEAKKSLYLRLRESLPEHSPPQRLFFDSYHQMFASQIPLLPALLPEVWLHWDPQTVKQRGAKALIRSRMDFLMLMRSGVRVVLEIDGQQHYSKDRRPEPMRYAEMVAADRRLKLDGYQVFRFGGAELQGERGKAVVKEFFRAMFDRFGVEIRS
ncbi:hypothetical protein [Symmachiella dynata]|uniref:AbiJ-related protein n=1 Tax=Symmachiella dynata TaxID=2527995 RepID=UPI0030EB3C00